MSDGTPPWDSLTHRLAKLRSAAESIERLAADYLLALRPVREALQAVADSPFADRDRWAGAVSNLAARMSENGMADVPKSLEDVDRWNLQFDAGKPGRAFAGKAFCNALAAAIADGASRGSFFVTLDQHSFITTSAAMQEVCAVLSRLLYVHTERTAPRFTKCYGEILIEVGIDGETLRLRLAQFGTSLSSEAASAVHDWDECSSGIPLYRVDIRPEAECMGATNGSERSEPVRVDEELASKNLTKPNAVAPGGKGRKSKPHTSGEERAIDLWDRRDRMQIPDYATLSKELKTEGITITVSDIAALFDRVRQKKARAAKKVHRTK